MQLDRRKFLAAGTAALIAAAANSDSHAADAETAVIGNAADARYRRRPGASPGFSLLKPN